MPKRSSTKSRRDDDDDSTMEVEESTPRKTVKAPTSKKREAANAKLRSLNWKDLDFIGIEVGELEGLYSKKLKFPELEHELKEGILSTQDYPLHVFMGAQPVQQPGNDEVVSIPYIVVIDCKKAPSGKIAMVSVQSEKEIIEPARRFGMSWAPYVPKGFDALDKRTQFPIITLKWEARKTALERMKAEKKHQISLLLPYELRPEIFEQTDEQKIRESVRSVAFQYECKYPTLDQQAAEKKKKSDDSDDESESEDAPKKKKKSDDKSDSESKSKSKDKSDAESDADSDDEDAKSFRKKKEKSKKKLTRKEKEKLERAEKRKKRQEEIAARKKARENAKAPKRKIIDFIWDKDCHRITVHIPGMIEEEKLDPREKEPMEEALRKKFEEVRAELIKKHREQEEELKSLEPWEYQALKDMKIYKFYPTSKELVIAPYMSDVINRYYGTADRVFPPLPDLEESQRLKAEAFKLNNDSDDESEPETKKPKKSEKKPEKKSDKKSEKKSEKSEKSKNSEKSGKRNGKRKEESSESESEEEEKPKKSGKSEKKPEKKSEKKSEKSEKKSEKSEKSEKKSEKSEKKSKDEKKESENSGNSGFVFGASAPATSSYFNSTNSGNSGKSVFGSGESNGSVSTFSFGGGSSDTAASTFTFGSTSTSTSTSTPSSGGFVFNSSAPSASTSSDAASSGKWKCLACEHYNEESVMNCEECFSKKPVPKK